jgi:hypothetical protein
VPAGPKLRDQLIDRVHSLDCSGHLGDNCTYEAAQHPFWWVDLKDEALTLVSAVTAKETSIPRPILWALRGAFRYQSSGASLSQTVGQTKGPIEFWETGFGIMPSLLEVQIEATYLFSG